MDHSPRPEDQGRGPGYETRDLALKPIIYFVVGLVLLRKIDVERGRAAALAP